MTIIITIRFALTFATPYLLLYWSLQEKKNNNKK